MSRHVDGLRHAKYDGIKEDRVVRAKHAEGCNVQVGRRSRRHRIHRFAQGDGAIDGDGVAGTVDLDDGRDDAGFQADRSNQETTSVMNGHGNVPTNKVLWLLFMYTRPGAQISACPANDPPSIPA